MPGTKPCTDLDDIGVPLKTVGDDSNSDERFPELKTSNDCDAFSMDAAWEHLSAVNPEVENKEKTERPTVFPQLTISRSGRHVKRRLTDAQMKDLVLIFVLLILIVLKRL